MHLCAAKYKPPGECRQKGVDAPVSAVRFSVSISGVNVRKRRMLCVYIRNNLGESGLHAYRLATPNLSWETNLNTNIGLDLVSGTIV